jgi:hypothetical protein
VQLSWLSCIAVTLPNAFNCSLAITLGDEGITAEFFGMRWKKINWNQVRRVENFTTQVYDGVMWKAVSVVKIVAGGGRIIVRQSISNFLEFSQLISRYCEQYGILVLNK